MSCFVPTTGQRVGLAFLLAAGGASAGLASQGSTEKPTNPGPARPSIQNPYYQQTDWKVWRDDSTPVPDVASMARQGKANKLVSVTVVPPEATQRIYPLVRATGRATAELPPAVVYAPARRAPREYAGIWDDVYTSWSGLHGYVRPHWRGPAGSKVVIRDHIIHFVDVRKRYTKKLGVNFIHQSTTGMAHTITNGYSIEMTRSYEKLYFADALLTAPAHASFNDLTAPRSSDLFIAHVPTLFNSVGSSNSETMAITKMILAGGYLPPKTKLLLKRNGLYPAAMLYIWKAALPYEVPYDHELRHRVCYKSVGDRTTYPEKYSAAGINRGDMALPFHRYDDYTHMRNMVATAKSMDIAMPEAIFDLLEVEGGTSRYTLRKAALILQEAGQRVQLRVSTKACYDLQNRPLTVRWKLLYGERATRVEPGGEPGEYLITVPYDAALPEGRTVIALIANNGRFDSNPALITVYRKKGELPANGRGYKDYSFASPQGNRRPIVLDLQDTYVRRGKTVEIPLRAVDPEGFVVSFHQRSGEVGDIDGDVLRWKCPRKAAKGPRTVTIIASDGTSGNGYSGKQIVIHVGKPALLAHITADQLVGTAPLTVKLDAKQSLAPRRGTQYGWDFYTPSLKAKKTPFAKLTHGRRTKHTFSKPGIYQIALTIQSGKRTDTQTIGVLVTDKPAPAKRAAPQVRGNGVCIDNGDQSASPFDHTDFGELAQGKTRNRRFQIVNRSAKALTLRRSSVEFSGPHAKEFRVTRQPRGRIEAGGSAWLEIGFRPRGAGPRTAIVRIHSGSWASRFTVQGRLSE